MKSNLRTLALLGLSSIAIYSIGSAAKQEGATCYAGMHSSTAQQGKATEIDGVQRATIVIDGAYKPGSVSVKVGKPVELTFFRKGSGGCSETLVIPSLHFRKTIATGKKETVRFTPAKIGEITFECGMGMLRGKIVVQKA